MRQEGPGCGGPVGPLAILRKLIPYQAAAASDRLGWTGLEAACYRGAPASELHPPALTHHQLILFARPPDELELRYEGVNRFVPPPAGSVSVVPAGSPAMWRWSGCFDWLHVFLEPGLIARVAAEAFDIDPARMLIPPLDNLALPHLRAAMGAVDAELTTGSAGGSLAAESLANVLAVHLIRHVLAPRRPERRRDGALPRVRLRAVVEYVDGHLDTGLTLEQMAVAAQLSTYHFARQFKAATGMPPHQYVLLRRVDRAQQLLRPDGKLPLAEIAARAGFSDQSQFSRHFKRLVGVTPKQFRNSARNA
jgi:AraC family transcriptional regulator